jgi:hypothetical protein
MVECIRQTHMAFPLFLGIAVDAVIQYPFLVSGVLKWLRKVLLNRGLCYQVLIWKRRCCIGTGTKRPGVILNSIESVMV